MTQATAMTPQEQVLRDLLLSAFQGRLPTLQGRAGETGEQLFGKISPTARSLADILQQRLLNPPTYQYQPLSYPDLFEPLFQRARQDVAASANQRGIVGSGLELEKLGRAGVDLALSQAQGRLQTAQANEALRSQAAQLNEQFRGSTISDASNLVGAQSGLSDAARAELANYLGQGNTLADTFRARQAGGAVQAQAAAQPYFSDSLAALQNRVNQSRQMTQGIGGLLGGVALGALTGGIGLIPGLAGGTMGAIGGGLGAGMGGLTGYNPISPRTTYQPIGASVSDYLARSHMGPYRW